MVSLYVQHHKSWDYNNGDNDNDDVANDGINNDNKYQKMIAIIVTIKNFCFKYIHVRKSKEPVHTATVKKLALGEFTLSISFQVNCTLLKLHQILPC